MDLTIFTESFKGDRTPLVRTDFSNDAGWQKIINEVLKPVDFENPANTDPGDDGYVPNVVPLDDRTYEGATGATLADLITATDYIYGYVLLADARSMSEALSDDELTLDYVDLCSFDPEDAELFGSYKGRTFRCAVSEIPSIEANLAISNLNFSEFADSTDSDGVFRGFGDD